MWDKILTCHLHNEAAVCSVTALIRRRVKYLVQPDCKIDGGSYWGIRHNCSPGVISCFWIAP